MVIAYDRKHAIYVIFRSCGFYDVARVLITGVRSFQALVAILPWLTHLASISYWYRSDVRRDKFRSQAAYSKFQNCEVMAMSVVGGQPKTHANLSYKATKHIERTFLISGYH